MMAAGEDMDMDMPLVPHFSSQDAVMDMMSVRAQMKKPWEFQCDYQDDKLGEARPAVIISEPQLPAPWEEDKLVDLWALSLEGEGAPMGTGRFDFVEKLWFQSMVGGVIFANALIIGAETDIKSSWWAYVENFLLTFFVMELLLRMLHFGCSNFLRQVGNLFDLFIVLSGVFDMWSSPEQNTTNQQ